MYNHSQSCLTCKAERDPPPESKLQLEVAQKLLSASNN
jgi:hypothetical protein